MFKFWKKDRISTLLSDTFIGEGTIVEGAIRSAGSVRLEGQLRGDLFCEGDALLGETAFAVSNITARSLHLAGQVTGNVRVSGKLTITSTGKLVGDMDAATLEIEEGGVFQGKSAMDMGEPVVSPLERRGGGDRRVKADPNRNGEERRSGDDRRNREDRAGMPRKFSFRAPESAGGAEDAAPAEAMPAEAMAAEAESQAAASCAAGAADPLRESGRAFMQSVHGGGVRATARAAGVSEAERAALGVPGQAARGSGAGACIGAAPFDAARGVSEDGRAAWSVPGRAAGRAGGASATGAATFGAADVGRATVAVSIDELLMDELGGESAEATFVAGGAFARADVPGREVATRIGTEGEATGAEIAADAAAAAGAGTLEEEAGAPAGAAAAAGADTEVAEAPAGFVIAVGTDTMAKAADAAALGTDAAEADAAATGSAKSLKAGTTVAETKTANAEAAASDEAALGMTAVAHAGSEDMDAGMVLSGSATQADDAEDAHHITETDIAGMNETAVRRGKTMEQAAEASENADAALHVAATDANSERDRSLFDAGAGGAAEDGGTVVRIAATSMANIVETAEAPDWPVFDSRRPARRAAAPAPSPAAETAASRRDEEAAALLRNW